MSEGVAFLNVSCFQAARSWSQESPGAERPEQRNNVTSSSVESSSGANDYVGWTNEAPEGGSDGCVSESSSCDGAMEYSTSSAESADSADPRETELVGMRVAGDAVEDELSVCPRLSERAPRNTQTFSSAVLELRDHLKYIPNIVRRVYEPGSVCYFQFCAPLMKSYALRR